MDLEKQLKITVQYAITEAGLNKLL